MLGRLIVASRRETQDPSNAMRWLQGWPRPFWGGCWWAWEAVLWSALSSPSRLRTQSKSLVTLDAAVDLPTQAGIYVAGTQKPCHTAGRQALPGTRAVGWPAHIVHASGASLVCFLKPWLPVAGELL